MSSHTQAEAFCTEFVRWTKCFCDVESAETKNGIVVLTFADGSKADMTEPKPVKK